MKFHDFPQGSAEWLQARAGCITASRFKDARDRLKPKKDQAVGDPSAKCAAYAAQVAVERIAGRPIDQAYQSWQMQAGTEQEPFARRAYALESGNLVTEAGLVTTDDGMFGYSSDGFVGDDGLIEIKTILSADRIVRVLGDGDISDYRDQCLGGLWLTGRAWIDLVLWCPALEPVGRHLTIHRITRNEDAIQALEDDLMAFAAMVRKNEQALRGAANIDAMKEAA